MNIDDVDPLIQVLYRVLELTGVFLASIVGGTVARRMNFDIVGFIFMALVSSLGGGIIRDVMIGRGTVAAISTPDYLLVAIAGALIAWLTYLRGWFWEQFQYHADMVVLGVWAVTGTTKALTHELPYIACVFMGILTALGGGMIRDVAIGKMPALFQNQQMYVIPCIVASGAMIAFFETGHQPTGMVVAPIIAFTLAMASYWLGWYIPAKQDFAPVNTLASQLRSALSPVEESVREVARDLEPDSMREWRHEQMEEAQEEMEEQADDALDEVRDDDNGIAAETLTEHAVKKEIGASASKEQFFDALYRAYVEYGDSSDTREQWRGRKKKRARSQKAG